jgi:hypothetical protein
MKWFTEPSGKFVIKIPIDWQYRNVAVSIEEKSPFCFEPYENPKSSFQISCYSADQLKQNTNVPIQDVGVGNLHFITSYLGDKEFKTKLWFASVGDHTFIIKYVYSLADEGSTQFNEEMKIVEGALSTLQLLPLNKRELAVSIDKYEKFMAALGASFDIKNKALENDAVIEFMVITANQIDAYLRMALVLKKQLNEKSDKIDILLLFQGENDSPVMERAIYKQALVQTIIDQQLFDDLDALYKERNKVIHRYIITDLKTRSIYQIAIDYDTISERVRQALRKVEDTQMSEQIGIHKGGLIKAEDVSAEDLRFLHSQVNDKHLVKDMSRSLSNPPQKTR